MLATCLVGLAALVSNAAWADPVGNEYGPAFGMHMYDSGWHGLLMGPLMMIAFVVVTVIAVLLIIRWMGASNATTETGPVQSPVDVLRERFAKGDIDESEFHQRMKVLSNSK